jgi:hypothetical protein
MPSTYLESGTVTYIFGEAGGGGGYLVCVEDGLCGRTL